MFGNLSPLELMVIVGLAVLLFGRRLPEVGRTLGKGIVEFKKGIRGLEDEFRFDDHSTNHAYRPPEPTFTPSDTPEAAVPKFELPSSPPVAQSVPRFEPPTAAPAVHSGHAGEPTAT